MPAPTRVAEASQRLDEHLDNSPLAVIELNAHLCIVRWSAGAVRQFGWSAEEVMGRGVFDLHWVHEEDLDAVRRVIADMVADQSPSSHVIARTHRKNGAVRDCEWYNSAIYDAQGRLCSLLSQVLDISEHKHTESALADRYELVAAGTCDAIWDWDVPNHRVYFSPRWKELRGLATDEVSDHEEEWSSRIHPDDTARVMAALQAHWAGEIPVFEQEYRIRCKDGSWKWILDRGIARRDATGRVIRMAGSESDITERKATEESLRRQVELTRHYVDTVQTVIVALDVKGRITMINRAGREMLGYAEHELLGRNWFETCLPQPQGSDRVYPTFLELMAGKLEAVEYFENPIRCRDGRLRLIAWHNSVLTDTDGGKIIGTLSSGEDITERKRAEDALRASEARFRQLADAMPQLVWTADQEGTIDYCNSRAAVYAGLTEAPDSFWNWQTVLHPDDVKRTVEAWRRATGSGRIFECEHRMRMADHSVRWHLCRAVPVRDEAGQTTKWFGTATDIHDLKLTQQALEEADRRKDEFLATLAHELRNPLAPIRNAAEVLRLKAPTDPVVQAAQNMIDRQLGHMVHLIDDLLDVSRITRGTLRLNRERMELTALLEQVVESFRPEAERAGQIVTLALPPAPIHLNADPVRLAQVVHNLLDNARKYTSKGGMISLSAEHKSKEVVVRVSDTGIGIAPEHMPRLFEMFSQLDANSEQSQDGLGIGLALARALVEMHGGRIEVRSEGSGKGSEFTLRFPPLAAAPEAPAQSTEACATSPMVVLRVLVVDDNPDIVDSLAMLLELSGAVVEKARDGLEAFEVAGHFRPHLVLLDIGMPRLDGYAACRRIREQPWSKDMHIVALTGWGQDDARHKSKEAGFDGHLVKPVDITALRQLLADLDRARAEKG